MNIYFAGSIRGGRNDQDYYCRIIEMLKDFGEVLTEHIGSKTLDSSGEDLLPSSQIYHRDVEWLEQSNFLVADVSSPSLGVGLEIGYAIKQDTPVLCLFREEEGRRLSAMIEGNPAVTVRTYKSIKEIPGILLAFFS